VFQTWTCQTWPCQFRTASSLLVTSKAPSLPAHCYAATSVKPTAASKTSAEITGRLSFSSPSTMPQSGPCDYGRKIQTEILPQRQGDNASAARVRERVDTDIDRPFHHLSGDSYLHPLLGARPITPRGAGDAANHLKTWRSAALGRSPSATRRTTMHDRFEVSVTFDPAKGYVATAPALRAPVTALSLGGVRRRIEIALLPRRGRRAARARPRRAAGARPAPAGRRGPGQRCPAALDCAIRWTA
jgi:hypothetical protein